MYHTPHLVWSLPWSLRTARGVRRMVEAFWIVWLVLGRLRAARQTLGLDLSFFYHVAYSSVDSNAVSDVLNGQEVHKDLNRRFPIWQHQFVPFVEHSLEMR